MKTFLVVSEKNLSNHMGEEWDDYMVVANQPTTENIQEWANRIRGRIRKLNVEDKKENDDPRVEVQLDAASPFNAMLVNLQIIMKIEENVEIDLPYFKEVTTDDPEALRLIEQLDR